MGELSLDREAVSLASSRGRLEAGGELNLTKKRVHELARYLMGNWEGGLCRFAGRGAVGGD